MLNKKILMLMLLFLIIAIGTISQVSASDLEVNDEIVSVDASIEDVSINENEGVDLASSNLLNDDAFNSTIVENTGSGNSTAVVANSSNDTQPTVKKVKIAAKKQTTIYKSHKKFQVKVLDGTKVLSGVNLKIMVNTGSKYKTYAVKTNSKGIAAVDLTSLKLGYHKIVIKINDKRYTAANLVTLIKINPRPVTIKAIPYKLKEASAIFGYVKDTALKKYVDGIPIKILVYAGKKYKAYKLVTGYDSDAKVHGAVGYLTNIFSVGTHKVKIIASGIYRGSLTAKITILKSTRNFVPMYGFFY